MTNLLDTVLRFLPPKAKAAVKNIREQKPDERIEKNTTRLKDSLGMFSGKTDEPKWADLLGRHSLKKLKGGLTKRKEQLNRTLQFVAPGTPAVDYSTSKQQKEEAIEMMRSGKIEIEVEEIKKEWLMEESKARIIFGNPNLTYEESRNLPFFKRSFEDAEKKWNEKWEKSRDELIPSLKAVASKTLIQQTEDKHNWVTEQLPFFMRNIPYDELRNAESEWVEKKEVEYERIKETSAYLGMVAKTTDKDLIGFFGKDKIVDMEIGQALLGATDPKKILTAMSLDTINFEDVAELGQDVYFKNEKMYYRGFEIDEEYLTDQGKQTAFIADLVARFIGATPTYGVTSGLIKKGVYQLARAKDVPKYIQSVQKLAKGVKWASKKAPILTELTAFNTLEELTEAAVRKSTGQNYTFNNFVAGLMMSAGMGGTLRLLGRSVSPAELQRLIRTMEDTVKETKNIELLRDLTFKEMSLDSWFGEARFAYLKGTKNAKVRPGIEKPAPLPVSKVEIKTRGLSLGVEAKAIEKKLSEGFADMPLYLTVNMKDQAIKAVNIVKNNYDLAKDIAMGKTNPPKEVLPESLFIAVENKALLDGDVATLRELATQSRLNAEATTMGQRIRTLGERDPYSPVSKMREVIKEREKVTTKKLKGKSPDKVKGEIKKDIKERIDKIKPTKKTWSALIDEITC